MSNKRKPVRLQLSRRKGFHLQALSLATNGLPAVTVARPSKWGNPWKVVRDGSAEHCVELYRQWINGNVWSFPNKEIIRKELRGKNLACYCGKECFCHADILLELANSVTPRLTVSTARRTK